MSRIGTLAAGMAVAGTLLAQAAGGQDLTALAWRDHTPEQLRESAAEQRSKPMAALFYNRAYQLDLEHDFAFLDAMESRGDRTGTHDLTAHRTLVVMVELLAQQTIADPERRAELLNRFYNTELDAAELRFKGYDRVADSLVFD